MNVKVEQQFDAEILLCGAIASLIRHHDYSVYDVRYAVGAFTGQILSGLQQTDPETAAELARPHLSAAAGTESLEIRWASHSHGYPVNV